MYCLSSASSNSKISETSTNTDELLNHDKKIKIDEEFSKHCEHESSYYEEEADKLEDELKTLGISFEDLDQETKSFIDSLAEVATILNLKDPNLINYHLALNHLTREKYKVTEEMRRLSRDEARKAKKISELVAKMDYFEKEMVASKKKRDVVTAECNKRKSKASFFNSKTKEYTKKTRDYEQKLERIGCQPNLYHSKLVKDYEEISLRETKLKEIDAKLASYHDLPPNEELAKLKVEEAKMELLRLQRVLEREIERTTK